MKVCLVFSLPKVFTFTSFLSFQFVQSFHIYKFSWFLFCPKFSRLQVFLIFSLSLVFTFVSFLGLQKYKVCKFSWFSVCPVFNIIIYSLHYKLMHLTILGSNLNKFYDTSINQFAWNYV